MPLHTLRANIDYAHVEAYTTFGRIGVKVWIYLGEVLPDGQGETGKSPRPWLRGAPGCLSTHGAPRAAATEAVAEASVRPLRRASNRRRKRLGGGTPGRTVTTEAARGAPRVRTARAAPAAESTVIDVDAKTRQAPQSAARTNEGPRQIGQLLALRRVRLAGARAGVDHQPPDRSRSYRYDAPYQARRKSVDHDFPRQIVHEEACRNAARFGQRRARGLGRCGAPWAASFSSCPASSRLVAKEALTLAAFKLPIRTKVLSVAKGRVIAFEV